MRLFFATDLHGSSLCFKKFVAAKAFYRADLLVLGGDLTGKGIVPIVRGSSSASYRLYGKEFKQMGEAAVQEAKRTIESVGFYSLETDEGGRRNLEEETALMQCFGACIREQIEMWDGEARKAGVRVYVIPGNDDIEQVDVLLERTTHLMNVDEKVLDLPEGWSLLGLGGSNSTPWKTFREFSERDIEAKLDRLMQSVKHVDQCIWNVHVPPVNSGLDVCEALDERYRVIRRMGQPLQQAVGSVAVDRMMRKWQPPLGLFGHIHEARGWRRIGRSVCVNPGSEYFVGVLNGCLVELEDGRVKNFQLTSG